MASLAPWTAPCRQLCQISTEMFTERRHAGAELPKIRRSRYTRSTCALSNADYWHSRHGSVVIEFLSSLTGDGSDHQRSRRRNQWSSSSLKPLYRAKLDLIDLIYGNKRSINTGLFPGLMGLVNDVNAIEIADLLRPCAVPTSELYYVTDVNQAKSENTADTGEYKPRSFFIHDQ